MNYSNPNYYENGELFALNYVQKRIGDRAAVLFDVGANVGDYALALHTGFGETAKIYAFEPAISTYQKLQANTREIPAIQSYNFGLSNSNTRMPLYFDTEGSTIASIHAFHPMSQWKAGMEEDIELRTLDDFCVEAAIPKIDFLKIDVEGHELMTLKGAQRMLAADAIQFIQFEFGFKHMDARVYFRDFYEILNDRYRLFRIVVDGLYPIESYSENREIFVGVSNYLAEHR